MIGAWKKLRRGLQQLVAGAEEGEGIVAVARAVPVREVFRRFWPYARPYRRWLPLVLFFVALVPATEAATIWVYKVLVDDVLVARNFDLLLWVILAYIGLTLAEGVARFCDEYLSDWIGGRFIVSLRTDFFSHLHGLSLAFFDRQRLGDVLSRITDDVEEIEELMLSGLSLAISYAFQLLFFTAALFYLNWQLALVSLFVVPLFWITARHFSRKIKRAAREERRRAGSIGAVARLLLRFYDPNSGAVRLGGHDLRDLTLHSLRENVAVLLQETLVFDGTVRENIAYGKPGASEEEIIEAARAADAHDFIEALPEGYDTVVGQKGRLLSGGQRQRIAIARAMVRDAPVLVLDEPTTGLDAGSGEKVMKPLRRLMSGRTTVVISHNLMRVREASEIVVLEGGGVAERGSHAGLLEKNGTYARLYRLHDPDAAAQKVEP